MWISPVTSPVTSVTPADPQLGWSKKTIAGENRPGSLWLSQPNKNPLFEGMLRNVPNHS